MLGMKALHFATLVPTTLVYTLPTANKADEIARERLDPLGRRTELSRLSDAMIKRIVSWKATKTKKFRPEFGGGTSTLMLTGSWHEGLGESTAADVLLLDELDRIRDCPFVP